MSCNNSAITPVTVMPILIIIIYLANFLIEWKRRANRISPQGAPNNNGEQINNNVSTISAMVPQTIRVVVPCIHPNQAGV